MCLTALSFVNFHPHNTISSLAQHCFGLILLCRLFTGLKQDQMGESNLKLEQVILMVISAF